jgi:class 3 adenylate cyclase
VQNRMFASPSDLHLLLVIARTARCARFVHARGVVSTTNKVNWYWAWNQLQWLNPFFYHRRYRTQRRQSAIPSLGITGEDSTIPGDEEKKSSWGVLQIGILAAVHAQAEAEAKEAREAREANNRSSIGGAWRKLQNTIRLMGLVRNEKALATRHEAAMKIQRAWRNHVQFEITGSIDGELGDLAHSSAIHIPPAVTSLNRSNFGNSSSKAARKRSALVSFSNVNAHAGGKADIRGSGKRSGEGAPESRFQERVGRESQVGSDMRKLTGQRVAIGTLFALACTALFTYTEPTWSWPTTMVVLHKQTLSTAYRSLALEAAVSTSVPELFMYQPVNGTSIFLPYAGVNPDELRDRDMLVITVAGENGSSIGWFDNRSDTVQSAWVEIVATFFIIFFWFFGVTAFSGPVMLLVIIPIERMVRLLGMLMLDPLGYQSTARFKKFLLEEDDIIKTTRWTKDVLKGMETSFLMSTILRIGSLMKVGFGSAGVEIIQNNLEKGQNKNMLILSSQGSTVSCIFLFCDIRQFTDATEQLQEEVFVFTNRIAAVVHSICHSYGGAANKNVGDAFLLSWSLEDQESGCSGSPPQSRDGSTALKAKSNQADKALLSVIKICISLNYDKFYLEPLSDIATTRLKTKLKNRIGPVVQMGFGLHAGKAVQGAIGSQRKIDATYVSEAVERAEFLEASTKKYGLKMLLSSSFYRLLHSNTRRRCRKIDNLFLVDEDEDNDEDDDELLGELMEVYTFDMDLDAIRRPSSKNVKKVGDVDASSDGGSISGDTSRLRSSKRIDRRAQGSSRQMIRNRRRSTSQRPTPGIGSEEFATGNFNSNLPTDGNIGMGSPSVGQASVSSIPSAEENNPTFQNPPELVLPTGPALYSHNVWQSPDMKRLRDKYVQGMFFHKFNTGLQAYYSRDWDTARLCFQAVLDNFDDGPSMYFISQIRKHDGVPPRDFREYTVC